MSKLNVTNKRNVWLSLGVIALGLFGIAAALHGYLKKPIPMIFRLLLAVGGIGMMIPGTLTDMIGLVFVGGIVAYQYLTAKKEAAAA